MGLDTSHDCWHGSYSSFGRWREAVCLAANLGSLNDYLGFGGSKEWPDSKAEPLVTLLHHSDCDGQIEVVDLVPLADRLEQITPLLDDGDSSLWSTDADRARQFVRGLRLAAEAKESVRFH